MAAANFNETHNPLWKYSKIITKSGNGALSFNDDNFNKLLKSVSLQNKRLPVSLIAIIGPRGSGKSFYTDLLIQYLNYGGTQGWLTKLLKKKNNSSLGDTLNGFAYGNRNVSNCEEIFSPDENASGIYMYPRPFPEQSLGEGSLVWVLHAHHIKRESPMSPDSLEALLSLICSKIIEIIWKTKKLTSLETRQYLSEGANRIPKSALCKDIVFLNRTCSPKTPIIAEDKGQGEVVNHLKQIQSNLNDSVLENIERICIADIKDCVGPLHDTMGKLTLAPDMFKRLQNKLMPALATEDILNVEDKNGKTLSVEKLGEYLKINVALINRKFGIKFTAESVEDLVQLAPEIKQDFPEISPTVVEAEDLKKLDQDESPEEIHSPDEFRGTSELDLSEQIEDEDENNGKPIVQTQINLDNTEGRPSTNQISPISSTLLEAAHRELQIMMKHNLYDWLTTNLNISTINYCGQIYETCLDELVGKYTNAESLADNLHLQFKDELVEKTASEKVSFSNIHKAIHSFHSNMKNRFEICGCFESSDLEKLIEEAVPSLNELNLNESSQVIVEIACHCLGRIYKDHNQLIAELEQGIARRCSGRIRRLYQTTMGKITKNGEPLPPVSLDRIHSVLTERYKSSLKIAFRFTPDEENCRISDSINKVSYNLAELFQPYKKGNLDLLKTQHEQYVCSINASKKDKTDKDKSKKADKRKTRLNSEKEAAAQEILTEIWEEAYGEMLKIMEKKLNSWVNTKLDISTINQCEMIYEDSLDELFEKVKIDEKMTGSLHLQFKDKLKQSKKTARAKTALSYIQQSLQTFHAEIFNKFQQFGCFEISELEELIKKSIQTTLNLFGEKNKPFAELAFRRLEEIYISHNKQIIASEQNIASQFRGHVRRKYKICMAQVMNRGPFTPRNLSRIHKVLLDQCTSSFKVALNFSPGPGEDNVATGDIIDDLKDDLNSFSQNNVKTNLDKLVANLKKIINLIRACKREYDEKMDKCLDDNPDGVDEKDFTKLHEATKVEVTGRLENDIIRDKCEHHELIHCHVTTLRTQVNETWIGFREDNEIYRKRSVNKE